MVRYVGEPQADPPAPGLVIGDAPWNPGQEVWDGVLRGFQFYDSSLTLKEIAKEVAAPGTVRMPWYLNLDPTPEDINDKSGNGNHPRWVGHERPSLWAGTMSEKGVIRTKVRPH